MRVVIADHPLITHKLTVLRDKQTPPPTFRLLVDELMTLLAYEATRDVRVEPFEIRTPVAATTGIKLANPKPLVVPILRLFWYMSVVGSVMTLSYFLFSAKQDAVGVLQNLFPVWIAGYSLFLDIRHYRRERRPGSGTHGQVALPSG